MIRFVVGLFLLIVTNGCTQYVDTSCTAFKPITYSASGDTPDTKLQIKEHNAAWAALCK